jgi:putative acetyltransferase
LGVGNSHIRDDMETPAQYPRPNTQYPFTIRVARPDDSPEVVRVIKAVYDEYGFTWDAEEYHADLYDLKGHYIDHGCPFFVAELAPGRLGGTAALEVFPALPGETGTLVMFDDRVRIGGCDCSMERLYVDPETRRSGMGRALTQQLIAAAVERGLRHMEIWSDKRFDKAHALYKSFGARVVGDRICHDPDQSPEWGLILDLGCRIADRGKGNSELGTRNAE